MFHRFTTWWRALVVVLLSLATVTWPSAAWGQATSPSQLLHQDPVASLSTQGRAFVTAQFSVPSSQDHPVIGVTVFTRLTEFSQVQEVLSANDTPPMLSVVAAGAAHFDRCAKPSSRVIALELDATGAPATALPSATCSLVYLRLALHCARLSCEGVYPVRYSVAGSAHLFWSLLTVQATTVATPLAVSFIGNVSSSSLSHLTASVASLRALGALRSTPLSLTADYRVLTDVRSSELLRSAYASALRSPLHQLLNAPPANVDFGGLEAAGFASQVTNQLQLGSVLATSLTGRDPTTPDVLSGTPSSASLVAITEANAAKQSEVVLPESDLVTPPSSTLTWGTPFHVPGVNNLTALAVNAPLSNVITTPGLSDGQRTALLLGALAFLHFEAPSDTQLRSVVIEAPVAALTPAFVNDFFRGLAHFSYATASPLAPLFSPTYVATSGAPATQALITPPVSVWSSSNIESLNQLIAETTSFTNAITSHSVATGLQVAVATAETVGSPTTRQQKIAAATNALTNQLNKFSIDSGAITLAGSGTQLPITILSKAPYSVTVVVHLVTNRLSFPKGSSIVTTLNSSTKSLRIPTAKASGSDLTLQVEVTTPDGLVVLARSAIQVRIAGTSVIGYLLSFASLLVLAAWWLRTTFRRSKGRRAR